MLSRLAIAALAACTRPVPAAPPLVEPPLLVVRDEAFGPITPKTPATLAALRRVLAGYEVAPVNNENLEYRVSKAGVRLFDIVPDEAGTILNIHSVSPKIEIAGRPWRAGAAFDAATITTCECWGDQTVCFKDGEHVAVGLAKICREGTLATSVARRALTGVSIRTAIWSARPLAPGGYEP